LRYSPLSDTLAVSELTSAGADSVFTRAAGLSDALDYSDCNVCKSRAHILARALEKHFAGVRCGKVWLFADSKRKSQREKYRTKPEVWLTLPGTDCRAWGYHVAPVIVTALDTFVIDPATQSKAVTLREWARKIIPAGSEGFAVMKVSRYYIFPDDERDLFEDELAVWIDDNESLLDEEYSRSIDELVRASLGLVEPWKMRERAWKIKQLIIE
jgi:hypothetical protein